MVGGGEVAANTTRCVCAQWGVCSSNKGKRSVLPCLIRWLCAALSARLVSVSPSVERDGSPPLDHPEKKFRKDLLHTFVICLSSNCLWGCIPKHLGIIRRYLLVYPTVITQDRGGARVWCCLHHWKCWGVQRGYFWISDIVSMAADASHRKALRYQQTLVGFPSLYLSTCVLSYLFFKLFLGSLLLHLLLLHRTHESHQKIFAGCLLLLKNGNLPALFLSSASSISSFSDASHQLLIVSDQSSSSVTKALSINQQSPQQRS